MLNFETHEAGTSTEIRLSRQLATVIEAELLKGTCLPNELMLAYRKLCDHYRVSIDSVQ